jgi:hypothetical protein
MGTVGAGARDQWVGEPLVPVFFEFAEVAECRALTGANLAELVRRYGSVLNAAAAIGASEAFVRQNMRRDGR